MAGAVAVVAVIAAGMKRRGGGMWKERSITTTPESRGQM